MYSTRLQPEKACFSRLSMSSKTAYCRTQVNRTRPDYTAPRIHGLYLKRAGRWLRRTESTTAAKTVTASTSTFSPSHTYSSASLPSSSTSSSIPSPFSISRSTTRASTQPHPQRQQWFYCHRNCATVTKIICIGLKLAILCEREVWDRWV